MDVASTEIKLTQKSNGMLWDWLLVIYYLVMRQINYQEICLTLKN